MQNSFVLQRTGDFWIDLGLVSLWKILTGRSSDNPINTDDGLKVEITIEGGPFEDSTNVGVSLTLSPNTLLLEYDDEKILNQELSLALESTRPSYMGMAKTGRIWWQSLGRIFFGNQNPTVFFRQPNLITIERKDKWKTGICNFCGTHDRFVKKAGAGEHPLIVVPEKFSSFYSNLLGDSKICNWCAFASKFSPLRLFYGMSGNSVTAIGMESTNLIDLLNVSNYFSRLYAQSERYRNFPSVMNYTKYPLESFLDFIFATIQEVEKKRDLENRNLLQSGLISRVHVLAGTSGQGLAINRYYVIPNMPKVFDFISSCKWLSKEQKSYNSLFETAKSMIIKRGKDTETITREEFARRIFYNKDVTDILEEFLISNIETKSPFKRFIAINIDKFIRMYMLNQMGMDYSQLETAKYIGYMIGALAAKHEKSLLYNMRSIGNLNSLLGLFNQILVRYIDDIKPDPYKFRELLGELNNSNWQTYKSLIGIYAVLNYTQLKSKDQEQEKHEQVVSV